MDHYRGLADKRGESESWLQTNSNRKKLEWQLNSATPMNYAELRNSQPDSSASNNMRDIRQRDEGGRDVTHFRVVLGRGWSLKVEAKTLMSGVAQEVGD